MHTEFHSPAPVRVDLRLHHGEATLTAADTATVSVSITGDSPSAEAFNVRLDGDRLVIHAPEPEPATWLGLLVRPNRRAHLEVRVPAGSHLRSSTGAADVRLLGVWDDVEARQASGNLTIEHARTVVATSGSGFQRIERVAADARLRSGSGQILLGSVGGNLEASNGSGGIVVESDLAGEVALRTGSGGIRLADVAGLATLNAGSGGIRVGRLGAGAELRSGSGGIRIERADAGLSARTGSGSIQIAHLGPGESWLSAASGSIVVDVAPRTPVWTDIVTTSGSIRNGVTPVGEPEPGEPDIRLHARTTSGSVRLATAAGVGV